MRVRTRIEIYFLAVESADTEEDMPIGFTVFEKLFIQRMNKGPDPMLDIVAHMGFKAIITAIKLGIFAALADSPAIVSELAEKTGTDPVGLDYLLKTPLLLGYIKLKKNR